MSVLNPGTTFSNGEQLTADLLNDLVSQATFTDASIDNQSTEISGASIIVKDEGIIESKIATGAVTAAKLGTDAVTTVKILDANVTTAKIADANVTFAKLTDVIDDDTMATATATTLATSESIKAYVDSIPAIKAWCVFDPDTTGTNAPLGGSGVTSVTRTSGGNYKVNLSVAAPSATYACFASGATDNLAANLSIGAYAFTASTAQIQSTDINGNFTAPQLNVSFSAIW